MPFVHKQARLETLATIWPPGHMQKLCAPGAPSPAFAVSA